MIEQAARLLQQANANQMQLNIRIDGDKVTVIANAMLNPTIQGESEQALKLRAALTQPIVISGDIGEVDVSITDALIQYTDTYAVGAATHSNLLAVKVGTEKATKIASKGKTVVADKTPIPKVSEPEVSQESSAPSQASSEPEKESAPQTDNFMFGDADSL